MRLRRLLMVPARVSGLRLLHVTKLLRVDINVKSWVEQREICHDPLGIANRPLSERQGRVRKCQCNGSRVRILGLSQANPQCAGPSVHTDDLQISTAQFDNIIDQNADGRA